MNASEPGGEGSLEYPPAFDLEGLYDDPDDPAELTIVPVDPENATTEWLTIDAGYAVPIEETG